MLYSGNRLFRWGGISVCIAVVLISISGCMLLVGRGLRQGYDEVQAVDAIGRLTKKYPYIDFNQIFPDTYRFELPNGKLFDKIVRLLIDNGEVILKEDRKNGIIFTAAKEAPSPEFSNKEDDQSKIYYQQSIYLTSKNSHVTYVTNYPTVFKGDFQEIIFPIPRNVIRGIFFGTLTAAIYPNLKIKSLKIAKEYNIDTSNVESRDGDIVHEVKDGETLGEIARKYTGRLMNYKEIAKYNQIKDVTKIHVGQKIIIPQNLCR